MNLEFIGDLHQSLIPISNLWREFGVLLNLPVATLDAIQNAPGPGHDERRLQIMLGFLMGATTKNNIFAALQVLDRDFAEGWQQLYLHIDGWYKLIF